MAKYDKKENTSEDKKESSIEPTNTWINKTKSGKGFIIHIKDDFKSGDILLGGMASLIEFVEEERNGINLGIIVQE